MSNAIFPTLPGLAWSIIKTPQWSTRSQQSVSGKEIRMSNRSRPIWKFALNYEVLRGGSQFTELQQLMAFFNQRQGSFDSFLLQDSSDNSASGQSFGTGDGSTKTFTLLHAIQGWLEPIGYSSSPSVYVNANDWRGNTLQYSTARTNLALYSQQFDNAAWNKAGGTIASTSITAPDSTATADRFTSSTSDGYFGQSVSLAASTTYTGSVWLKAATGTLNTSLYFGARSQAVTLTTSWQRFQVSLTTSSAGSVSFQIGGASSIGNGVSVDVWGAQVEAGSMTPNIPTTSAAVTVTDYSTDGASVTFAAAPASGAALTWSGSFYYRVRFDKDALDFDQFMEDLWQLKRCDLIGVI